MTRMEHAKRRLRVARYAITAVAVSAFAAFGIAAKASHPATHHSSSTSNTTTGESDDSNSTFDFNGSSSFDNSGGDYPSIQSGGS
jgi:hypothetical protein